MKRISVRGRKGLSVVGDAAGGPAVMPTTPTAAEDGKVLAWDDAEGEFAWTTAGGGSGAPTTATYVVVSTDATLTNERRLQGTANRVTLTDGGAGGDLTLDVGSSVYVSGGTDVAIADGGTGASTAAAARSNLGIATAGRCAVLTAQAISAGSTFEVVTYRGARYLRLKRRTNFPVARSVAAASPEYGWTWNNRTALDSADENTTTANAMRWDHGATNTDWFGGTFNAPTRYRVYPWPHGRTYIITARISCNADATFEYMMIMAWDGAGTNPFVRTGVGWQSAGGPHIGSYVGGSSQVAITTAQRDAGVWLRIIINRDRAETYYSTSGSSTPPTSWTFHQTNTGMGTWTGGSLKIGFLMITVNTSNTLVADVHHYDVQAIDEITEGLTDSMSGVLWPATQYDATGTEQLVADDIDLGADVTALDNTRLRLILADLENRMPGDSATITWSYKMSASTGATSGTFRAAGSVVDDGAGGRYLRLWAKITSDGNTSGSIGPFPIPLPVA